MLRALKEADQLDTLAELARRLSLPGFPPLSSLPIPAVSEPEDEPFLLPTPTEAKDQPLPKSLPIEEAASVVPNGVSNTQNITVATASEEIVISSPTSQPLALEFIPEALDQENWIGSSESDVPKVKHLSFLTL